MGRCTVTQFADQIKRTSSPRRVNGLGRRIAFCYRERLITPYRPMLSLLEGHATGRRRSILMWPGGRRKALALRLVARWNSDERRHTLRVTKLPQVRFDAGQVDQVYRPRWQMERLFKEWKSCANLHAFDTSNAGIAASILKRYVGQMTRTLRGVVLSTRKVATRAHHGLVDVFRVLACGPIRDLFRVLGELAEYLAGNVTRPHPTRDRKKGRLQFGSEPVFVSSSSTCL